jgi:hypothetical protein
VFSWSPNGNGGANYYENGSPITNTQYGAGSGVNYGQLEQYLAGQPSQSASSSTGGGASMGYVPVLNPNYSAYNDYVNQMSNLIDQTQGNQTQQVNNNYNDSLLGLNNDYQTGQDNLKHSSDLVDQQQANSLRDLNTNMQNSFQQAQNQLGNLGAGDSSAVDQYSYALNKSGNQNRANILQQSNNNRDNINLQQNALGRQHDQQLSSLNTWKSNALLNISSQYAQQRAQLEQLRASAPAQYVQQLQQLNQGTMGQLAAVDQANQAQMAQLGDIAANSGYTGLDLSGTQLQPQAINVQPVASGLNFQAPINVNQLQSTSMTPSLQGSYGTAPVKKPWEY